MDQLPNTNNDRTNHEEPKARMMDYVLLLVNRRRFILLNVAIVTLVAVVVSLLLPKWYKATASVLPPKEQNMFGSFGTASSVLRNIASSSRISTAGLGQGTYNYLAILKSRSTMEEVVRKFDLFSVYEIDDSSMEVAVKALEGNVTFEIQPEEYITIDVSDKDPHRAADMANHFVETLNQVSTRLATQEARSNREFIEKRVTKCREDLHNAEEELKTFQEKSGILIVPEEKSSSLSAVAELYAMKAKKEIEIGILERTVTKDNDFLRQLRLELGEINKKVDVLPEAGIGALRLYREVAIQQKILEYLVPMFEQVKVDEQKNIPVMLVLDRAVPPEKKDRPKRMIIVLSSFLTAFLLSIVFVVVREKLSRFSKSSPQEFEVLANVFRRKSLQKHEQS